MEVLATTEPVQGTGADTVAVGLYAGEPVAHDLGGGALQRLLDRDEAKGAFRHLAQAHCDGVRVILVGLGEREAFDAERARVAAGVALGRARQLGSRSLAWELPGGAGPEIAQALVQGTLLGAYRFDRFRPAADEPRLERLVVCASDGRAVDVTRAAVLAEAQNRARDLANAPPNELTPDALARRALELADQHRALEVTVLDGEQIRAAGMGAFAAVAAGSDQDARLIELAYEPSDGEPGPGARRLGLLGKGVTFDSGGLAIKSREGMIGEKFDMAGAAAVIEAVGALARLQAPVRVLGVVGATENMISGGSMRPGDIVRALDGTTIEIDNPDAEGRLVLADCIAHARRRGCAALVDLATLTGAIVTALGSAYAGMMASDDGLAELVASCGARTGERVWRLPLDPDYARLVRGRYAQLTNRPERREAQAITAAELLHHFAGEVPWVHLDIAGVADHGRVPYLDRGATGWGVRLLVEVATSW